MFNSYVSLPEGTPTIRVKKGFVMGDHPALAAKLWLKNMVVYQEIWRNQSANHVRLERNAWLEQPTSDDADANADSRDHGRRIPRSCIRMEHAPWSPPYERQAVVTTSAENTLHRCTYIYRKCRCFPCSNSILYI